MGAQRIGLSREVDPKSPEVGRRIDKYRLSRLARYPLWPEYPSLHCLRSTTKLKSVCPTFLTLVGLIRLLPGAIIYKHCNPKIMQVAMASTTGTVGDGQSNIPNDGTGMFLPINCCPLQLTSQSIQAL